MVHSDLPHRPPQRLPAASTAEERTDGPTAARPLHVSPALALQVFVPAEASRLSPSCSITTPSLPLPVPGNHAGSQQNTSLDLHTDPRPPVPHCSVCTQGQTLQLPPCMLPTSQPSPALTAGPTPTETVQPWEGMPLARNPTAASGPRAGPGVRHRPAPPY